MRTRHVWTAGANIIISRRSGTVRPYGGGGAGVFMERRSSEVTVGSGPFAGVHRQVRSSGPKITGGAIAGVDVKVAPSTAIFAEVRVDVLAVSGGALSSWYLAGARLALH